MNGYDPNALESAFEDVWTAHLSDPEFRSQMSEDPHSAIARKGLVIPPEMDVRFHVNTPRTLHIVFPPDPNTTLSDETLSLISGGVATWLAAVASAFGGFAGRAASGRGAAPRSERRGARRTA